MSTSRRQALAAASLLATAVATRAAAKTPAGRAPRMHAWQVGAQQGIDSLEQVERDAPLPGPGEVLVAVRASALNHRDLSIAAGHYGKPKPASRIPLGDGAGEVIALGAGVAGIAVGERVTAPHFSTWLDGAYQPSVFEGDLGNGRDGWLAERIVLPATSLVRIPDGLSYEDAAALGAAAITAWSVLETFAGVKPGDVVLTLGTGGVAVLALQIARLAGARVAITSSSDAKLARVRALGASICVNYRTTPQWHEVVMAATGGRGVDIVVETVGVSTLPQSLRCCAPNARIGLLGALGKPAEVQGLGALMPMIGANAVIKGITSGSRRMHEDLLRAFASAGMRPSIDRVFGFEDAAAAYRYLEAGDFVGKIVIRHEAPARRP